MMTSDLRVDQKWSRVQRILFAPPTAVRSALDLYVRTTDPVSAPERSTLRLPAGAECSLATYFGAFPLGYWTTHAGVRRVRLRVRVEGTAEIALVVSQDGGESHRTAGERVTDGVASLEYETEVASGGWLWATIRGGTSDAVISEAVWEVPQASAGGAGSSATIAITTYNRTGDCVRLLSALADDDELRERLDRIVVVDQGTAALKDAPEFDEVSSRLDGMLDVMEQPNLGGSGGFSRGMMAATDGPSSHVLLLDDDVVVETESILRILAFADHSLEPLLVGAQMLSLTEPLLLHSFGERVDMDSFWWVPVDQSLAPVDLATNLLESTPALHKIARVDFNGWWMCLIPTEAVRRIGAALPLFIKWDDAEYGLRAREAGWTTVTLPGAALWHMPWTAKDDGLDWQAYFQLRNRLVTALVHSPRRHGGRVLPSTLAQDVNHVLCMQYGSAALRRLALRDVMSGPAHLPVTLRSRSVDARAILARANQVVVQDSDLPLAVRHEDSGQSSSPSFRVAITVLTRQLRKSPRPDSRPQVAVPRELGKWWLLGRVDSAVVRSATGTGAFVSRRNRRTAVALVRDAITLRAQLWWQWPALAARYQSAVPGLTSDAAWKVMINQVLASRGRPGP